VHPESNLNARVRNASDKLPDCQLSPAADDLHVIIRPESPEPAKMKRSRSPRPRGRRKSALRTFRSCEPAHKRPKIRRLRWFSYRHAPAENREADVSKYKIGKDIGKLLAKVKALEAAVHKPCSCAGEGGLKELVVR